MHDHEEKQVSSTPSLSPVIPSAPSHDDGTPDWLKDTTHETIPSTTPSWLTEEAHSATPEEKPKEEIIVPKPASTPQDESHTDIPDWLR